MNPELNTKIFTLTMYFLWFCLLYLIFLGWYSPITQGANYHIIKAKISGSEFQS